MALFDAEEIRREYPLSEIASKYGIALTADGREWRGLCPFHAERTPSFTIYPTKTGHQRYYCFGCAATGDVIQFVCDYDGVEFREACERLGARSGPVSRPRPAPEPAADPYDGITYGPVPDGTPDLVCPHPIEVWNPKRGRRSTFRPSAVYPYRNAAGALIGYVLRQDLGDGKKLTPAVLWASGPHGEGWCLGSMPSPRPIYRLQALTERPGAQVLIVEGEKCADAAATALPELIPVSWCGGGKAAQKTDWAPLKDRRVVIWPDNDAAGLITGAVLAGLVHQAGAAFIRLITPPGDEKPPGWDIADAIRDDWWDTDEIIQFAKSRARDWIPPEPAQEEPEAPAKGLSRDATRRPSSHSSMPPLVAAAVPALMPPPPEPRPQFENIISLHGEPIPAADPLGNWRQHLIMDGDGKIKPKLATNWKWMLRGHPEMRGVFAWNDVAQGVFVMRRPLWQPGDTAWRPRPLLDSDNFNAATWLEKHGMTPKKSEARDSIKVVAQMARYNPVMDYLTDLRWDGCPRLTGGAWEGDTVQPLAVEYLNAPGDDIFATFVIKWHVAAVARMMRPGCKVDTMVVFESAQGRKKSSYIRTMATIDGHEYFADSVGDITNPNSIMLLQGTWLVEVSELAGLGRKEIQDVKAWLSRSTDRFVPKFESEPREVPRHYVVAGSHNPSGYGYLKDPTGARRFWPVPTGRIDLDRVERDRDQIWAEAVHLYESGMKWWLEKEEDERASALLADDRQAEDPWRDRIEQHTRGLRETTVTDIISALAIPASQQSEVTVKRISEQLQLLGFARVKNGHGHYWTREAGSMAEPELPEMEARV